MQVRSRLKADLKAAMKAREPLAVAAIRSMMSALDQAEAVEVDVSVVPLSGFTPDVPRRDLSDEEIREVLRREVEEYRHAVEEYERLGLEEAASEVRVKLEVASRYLEAA